MKAVALILSFYIFALSIIQCADEIEDICELSNTEQISLDNHGHQDSEVPQDDCSPFCPCMCCQWQVQAFKPVSSISENLDFQPAQEHIFYNPHYLSQYLEAPFHPPKSIA